MIRRSLILLVMLTATMACRNDERYIVEGSATDFYNDEPVDGVEIEFAQGQISFGTVSEGYEVVGSTFTDESGQYQFAIPGEVSTKFRLRARKEGYLLQELIIEGDRWSTERTNRQNVNMVAAASIKFNMINTDDPNAQAILRLGKHSEGCLDCCPSNQSVFAKGILDTTFTCNVYGNQVIPYVLTRITQIGAQEIQGEIEAGRGENEITFDF